MASTYSSREEAQAQATRNRAEKRRQRILGAERQRLGRLGISEPEQPNTQSLVESAPATMPQGSAFVESWGWNLHVRRWERSCRFVGSALLGCLVGFGVLASFPPLLTFVMFDVAVMVLVACILWWTGKSAVKGKEREDVELEEMLDKLTGGKSTLLGRLDIVVRIASTLFALGKDAVWFFFAMLVTSQVRELTIKLVPERLLSWEA